VCLFRYACTCFQERWWLLVCMYIHVYIYIRICVCILILCPYMWVYTYSYNYFFYFSLYIKVVLSMGMWWIASTIKYRINCIVNWYQWTAHISNIPVVFSIKNIWKELIPEIRLKVYICMSIDIQQPYIYMDLYINMDIHIFVYIYIYDILGLTAEGSGRVATYLNNNLIHRY
jgi:hypothetical protein